MTIRVVYAHHGLSPYDELFLKALAEKYKTFLLTFECNPKYVPSGVSLAKMLDPFSSSRSLFRHSRYMRMLSRLLRLVLLRRRLDALSPDVLIACETREYGLSSAISHFRPLIVFVWGSDVLIAPRRFLPRFSAKYSLAKADAVLVDSEVQRDAVTQLGCNPSKIIQFPWFNPEDVYESFEANRDEIRKLLGWEDKVIVVSCRWHEPIYNVEALINAIPIVTKENDSYRFLIVGEGSLTEHLKRKALDVGIDKFVRFTGRVTRNDLINYLNASDIYVSTSLSDGTSASLLEAMCCRLAVIVTDIPANREWVKDGQNGLLFPCKDSISLGNGLLRLTDENQRRMLGDEALNTIRTKVNWHKNLQILNDTIERLAKKHPKNKTT